ncbi:ParB family protein [Armatimonadetes bacterium GBS]|jgi:ParB family chromosome partitioning protein|nr:ParB family protein [Armatimonadetes bacterium GBS]CUU36416.1 ParB family protein [Armatimonadetes bacterium GXS]
MEVRLIPIHQIVEDPDQPRKGYDEEGLHGLAESIRRYGLLNPITVRPLPDGKTYQIVTGERRWRAAELAGLTEIPCIVKPIEHETALTEQLIENLQREDLAPIDKARALKQLKDSRKLTNRELAQMLGLSERTISIWLGLLELPEEIGEQVISASGRPPAGSITESHARSLMDLEDPELQTRVAEKIREEELTSDETAALVRTLREAPERAEEILEQPAEQVLAAMEVRGPAIEVRKFRRYLEGLDVSAMHPSHLEPLEEELELLIEIIAEKLQEIRAEIE